MKKHYILSTILLGMVFFITVLSCKKANFDPAYVAANDGKTYIEVPEVKELLMVVVALTDYAQKSENDGTIYKNSQYYKALQSWFGKYKNEVIVKKINFAINASFLEYVVLSQDSYNFYFDSNGLITRKKDIKSETLGVGNFVSVYQDELQAFADKTNFRGFYKSQQKIYDTQTRYFKDSANFPKMVSWLRTNFPDVNYNSFRILFSPLAYETQSTTKMKDNNFSEAHMHINFPYLEVGDKSTDLSRGALVFTELNHNFENPESEKSTNAPRIKGIFNNVDKWKTSDAHKYYKTELVTFEEYMNWSLVSLWYLDNAKTPAEAEKLIKTTEKNQVEYRGFIKFAGFNQELIRLYKAKKKEETVASLFPKMIDWCEKQ